MIYEMPYGMIYDNEYLLHAMIYITSICVHLKTSTQLGGALSPPCLHRVFQVS